MVTLLIELTNRCNLNCRHCYDDRHGGHDEIQWPVMEKILGRAGANGFDTIVLTGGEPTLHSQFPRIVRRVYEAGYKFGFVSNGQNFPAIYPQLKPFVDRLETVTFSLEGAVAASHDRLRGRGTFVNLLKAVSVCVAKDIRFTFNTVLTARTVREIKPLTNLARQLGSDGIRFGQLMLTPVAMDHGLAVSPRMIKAAADQIDELNASSAFPIGRGPGFYTASLFPCAALQLNELTVTCSGHLALCCHLPDHGDRLLRHDPQLDLNTTEFEAAYQTWKTMLQGYKSSKANYFHENRKGGIEHLPCWFCQRRSGQLNWLKNHADTPWSCFVAERNLLGRQQDD